MQRHLGLIALMGFLLLSAGPILADDGFYVVGMGAGVGTKITSLPYTITAPGFYYVTKNLMAPAGQNGIKISANNVTLDLMGFKVSGPGWNNTGINFDGTRTDVEIRNGTLTNWENGIYADSALNVRVINVRIQAFNKGVSLGGNAHLIKGCEARYTQYSFNIGSGTVSGCTVIGNINSKYGINIDEAGMISNNFISNIQDPNGVGINVQNSISRSTVVTGNTVSSCTGGILIMSFATISSNAVSNCQMGIGASGTIINNSIFNCSIGIDILNACSIIGNTIINTFQAGAIALKTEAENIPTLVTQNTVSGASVALSGSTVKVPGTNAGF